MVSSQAIGRVARDVVLDVFLFPLWWYTKGFLRMMDWFVDSLTGSLRSVGLKVWLQNLFVPMYGRYDWQSRIISVFIRIVQIIFRSLALFVSAILSLIALGLYLILPILFVILLFYHGFGGLVE